MPLDSSDQECYSSDQKENATRTSLNELLLLFNKFNKWQLMS